MNTDIHLAQIRCENRFSWSRNSAYMGKWFIRPGSTFIAGSPLVSYRLHNRLNDWYVFEKFNAFHGGRLDFNDDEIIIRSPEKGVLVSTFRESGRISENELLGCYVPLEKWSRFSDLLDRHEEEIVRIKRTGKIADVPDPEELNEECRQLRMESDILSEQIPHISAKIEITRKEIEKEQRRYAELSAELEKSYDESKEGINGYPLSRLIDIFLERSWELLLDKEKTLPSISSLKNLRKKTLSSIRQQYPLSPFDYDTFLCHRKRFLENVMRFEMYNNELKTIHRDLSKDEFTRKKMMAEVMRKRRFFAINAFEHSQNEYADTAITNAEDQEGADTKESAPNQNENTDHSDQAYVPDAMRDDGFFQEATT